MAAEASSPAVVSSAVSPDDSWTVAQLREEARTRGLAGMSRKNKAELLAALGVTAIPAAPVRSEA